MLQKPFLTTHEVAAHFNVRERTVRTWIHQKQLRAMRLGRAFLVEKSDLTAFEHMPAGGRAEPCDMARPPRT